MVLTIGNSVKLKAKAMSPEYLNIVWHKDNFSQNFCVFHLSFYSSTTCTMYPYVSFIFPFCYSTFCCIIPNCLNSITLILKSK